MIDPSPQPDIPRWLCVLVLFTVSSSVFTALCLASNPYLSSTDGYADGGDMYSHQVEALYLKELLQSGSTDLWFDEVTLGYPFFLAYHPFPCLFTTSMMAATESFISPLLLFRWLFVILLSIMPWSWYIGLCKLGMTNLEATLAALCVHSIHSWRKFGLELDAFQEYGIFTQAYGMACLPLAMGFVCRYIMHGGGSRNTVILLVVLNFLCHSFCGIYVGIATGVMVLVDLCYNTLPLKKKIFSPSIKRAVEVHVRSIVLTSWWLVPLLMNFSYIGGLPWKNESENGYEFGFVLRQLMSGEMFDHGRKFPFITVGLLAGLAFICYSQHGNHNDKCSSKKRQVFLVWLGTLFVVTLVLFLGRTLFGPLYNLLPFHKEIEVVRYLSGIHFCGLPLMAISSSRLLCFVCATFSRKLNYILNSKHVLVAVMLVLPPIYLSDQLRDINTRLSVSDFSELPEGLKQIKAYPHGGRVLAQKTLGTGGPWHLALIPHVTRKPGILTYSRGYHDTLSLYYLELVYPDLDKTPWFPDLLRLYNIRFVVTSAIQVPSSFLEACQLRHLASDHGIDVFVREPALKYGYFEFAHVPCAVVGDLKGARDVVWKSTEMFTNSVVFALNPPFTEQNPPCKISVTSNSKNSSVVDRLVSSDEFTSKWFWETNRVQEEAFFAKLKSAYELKGVMSRVIQEEFGNTWYAAVVLVAEEALDESYYNTEHLLLKVTYHPYWTCAFHSIDDVITYPLSAVEFDQSMNWHVIPVHHVTPNLMSVVLPSGRQHVICKYKNPLYQKVGFVLFLFTILALTVNETIKTKFRR